MRVLALIEAPQHVCYRYRIRAFGRALAERGLRLEAVALARPTLPRLRQFCRARRSEVVILQRKLLPLWQLAVLRRAVRCLVYDVDDAVFQRDSFHRKGPASWQRLARFWATVNAADAVIAGNRYLHRRVACYVETDRVHLVPTCLEPQAYRPACHRRTAAGVRLVWIGQRATLPSLVEAEKHLTAAGQRLPGLQLHLICDRFVRLCGLEVVRRPWSPATEAADLADCDIGISWLPDDQWSRGKCGLKVLQYMAAGLPVVANPVGIHRRLVVHGRTGILASSPAEWAEAIGQLAARPEMRQKMGAAGRRLIQQRFSVARWGPRFAAIIRQAARRAATESCPRTGRRRTGSAAFRAA